MKNKLLMPVSEWPKFTDDGSNRRATVYQELDGRRYVHLTGRREPKATPAHISHGDSTRLIYRRVGDEGEGALLLGMNLRLEDRGKGIGRNLLRYFMENIEDQEPGAIFVGTGKIHKPVLALTLGRIGMAPRSEDFMAELLPPGGSQPEVPRIRVLKNGIDPFDIVDGNNHIKFYDEVRPADPDKLPDPSMVVALHTKYDPPRTL